ncbi:SDR family NAD(P)-dependent oxidoreductase [Streptococcus sp. H49]|uniref:SDR family NAD(P)-dependent oxidoreductase n=1 Tax=Streptococcus huangxiaojuni TaxID=3237239 RepID=UPI0034A3D5E2
MAKTILITGSTDGIGKHLALKLASEGHEIILHGRNSEKLASTLRDVKASSQNSCVSAYLADFSSMTDVYRFVREIKNHFTQIDILINNAGLYSGTERLATAENIEITFMLSVMVPYILTKELQPLLEHSNGGRIINTSSYMHHFAEPQGLDFGFEKKYSPKLAYDTSKLYTIWLTRYQAHQFHLQDSKITVNAYHPGLIATNLVKGSKADKKTKDSETSKLLSKAKGLDAGIKTGYFLALSPEVSDLSGAYFDDMKLAPVSEKGFSFEKAKQLIDYCDQKIAMFNSN